MLAAAEMQSADITTELETLATHWRAGRMKLDAERMQNRKKVLELVKATRAAHLRC